MNAGSRTEYQRNYMREWRARRKAAKGPSELERRTAALKSIIDKLDGRDGAIASEVRKLAEEALG